MLAGTSSFCIVYVDILIYSNSTEEHVKHLKQVLDRLRCAGLMLHPQKCTLARPEVVYLGHIVSRDGILPNPEKVNAVKDMLVPTNVKAVRQFLGLASYYRRFIPKFAKIANSLHALTHQDVPFVWMPDCQDAFMRLKELLSSPPVLAYPNFAVLEQEQADGKLHPIVYASRTLNKCEQKYGITEMETLGVVWAARHFRAYLYGHQCTLFTDHAPVRSLLKSKHPLSKHAHWAESLAELDIDIRYRPGPQNKNADALSRSPVGSEGADAAP